MADRNYTTESSNGQITCSFSEYEAVLANLEDTGLLQRLEAYRLVGRKGHPLRALWRAYVCSFLMNLPSTNALVRLLQDRPDFRIFCGFRYVPHRTTLNRFINRLSYHTNLVQQVMANLTTKLKKLLPDLGNEVAVDSTTVTSHSRPRRKDKDHNIIRESSDPEAGWTAKNSPRAMKDGKEWHWGYKYHLVADVNHDIPLGGYATAAHHNDNPTLPHLIEHAKRMLPWFKPKVVIGDKGYDAASNHLYLVNKGIIPVLHIRKPSNASWYDGVYTEDGVPTCIGQVPMSYIKTDPKTGKRLYRCTGCHLASRKGAHYCKDEVWEDPTKNLRLFGVIRRQSTEWKAYYRKRQGIERVFKSMKESRRLDSHCHRGLGRVHLHITMSALSYQATRLVNLMYGDIKQARWMVRKVA